jgi:alpha,alpha-trehalose phosphorylase
MVALDRPGVAAICYRLEALDQPARVVLRSELVANDTDSEVTNDDPRVADRLSSPFDAELDRATDCGGLLVHRTRMSRIGVAAAVAHELRTGARECQVDQHEDLIAVDIIAGLEPGEAVEFVKYLGYAWLPVNAPSEQLAAVAAAALADARDRGGRDCRPQLPSRRRRSEPRVSPGRAIPATRSGTSKASCCLP